MGSWVLDRKNGSLLISGTFPEISVLGNAEMESGSWLYDGIELQIVGQSIDV
jgi:hypothetical protein